MKKIQDNTKYEQSKEIHIFFKKLKKQHQLLIDAFKIFQELYDIPLWEFEYDMEEQFQEIFGTKKYKGKHSSYSNAYKLIQIYDKLFNYEKGKTGLDKILNRARIQTKIKLKG